MHGYVATVHKSQGITVDWAHVVATPGMDRHLAYVALSRHRHGIALHWSREGLASQEGLANRLGRERAKDTTLDYGESEAGLCAAYAERRGLRPAAPVHGLVAADAGLVQRNVQRAHIEPGMREALTALQVMAERQAATAAALQAAVERLAQRRAEQDAARAKQSHLDTLLIGLRPTDPSGPTPMFEAVIAVERARREREQPLAPVPGVPYRPVTKDEVDAVLAADEAFGVRQLWVTESLQRVYRDPAEAQARLEALVQRVGGIREAITELQQRASLLGELRGRKEFLSPAASQTERQRARLAAAGFVRVLEALDATRSQAADVFRRTEETRRRIEAGAVPGLSEQAMQAVGALQAAGAVPGWQGPMPGESVQPSAADIARAARVAPVWQGIRADAALYAEVGRFMAAAQQRLPGSYDQPAADGGTQLGTVQAVSSLLHAACELQRANPALQAYAAAEPERQAEVTRKADEAVRRQAEAMRVLAEQQEAQKAEYEAMTRRIQPASTPRRRKSPGPSTRLGGGPSVG